MQNVTWSLEAFHASPLHNLVHLQNLWEADAFVFSALTPNTQTQQIIRSYDG